MRKQPVNFSQGAYYKWAYRLYHQRLQLPRTFLSSRPNVSSGGNVEGYGVHSSQRIAEGRVGLAAADGGSDDGNGSGALCREVPTPNYRGHYRAEYGSPSTGGVE